MEFAKHEFAVDGPSRLQEQAVPYTYIKSFVKKNSVKYRDTNFMNLAEFLSAIVTRKMAKGPELQQYSYGLRSGMTLGIVAVKPYVDDAFFDVVINNPRQSPPGRKNLPAPSHDINTMFTNAATWAMDLAPGFNPLIDKWGPELCPKLPSGLIPKAFGFAVFAFYDAAEQLAMTDTSKQKL